MNSCHDFYFTYQVDEIDDTCIVKVYADEDGKEYIDSFWLEGLKSEEAYYEAAYLYIFDNEADFKLLMQPEYKCIVHAI